jgi:Ca2+-binding RTX toxin-like protein
LQGSPDPWALRFYNEALNNVGIQYSPAAESTISDYINQPYNFSSYHLGSEGADTIFGSSLKDYFVASTGNDTLKGEAGFDILRVHGTREAYSVSKKSEFLELAENSSAARNVDTLYSIEKIIFTNGALVFDVESANAPAAYRLYGGAFDRTPDEGGFRFWASTLDKNVSLRDVATQFINSGEFVARYGTTLGNAAFVDALYQNVLHRDGDAGGVAYWNKMLDNKLQDRSDVLVQFTQLPEFVGISAANISNGYWVV